MLFLAVLIDFLLLTDLNNINQFIMGMVKRRGVASGGGGVGVRHLPSFGRFVGKTRVKQKKNIERTRSVGKFIENGR